ncbi:MAG: ABC transporter ATP-binding protein [Gammaproteobacteria bacterium]
MNRDIAIKVESLSKMYRLGVKEQSRDSLGAVIFDFLRSPLKNYRKYRSLYDFRDIDQQALSGADAGDTLPENILWAVKNISFEIPSGQVVGIIGRNGAGKSTLLKILSRITSPTTGRAEIRGRVSSLLEVGTGFHQELTGRENVYLNGTILGMRKKEVDAVFDDIVEFSGVERFLDTPVKRYSSGMRVRLAFAVAAHLKPEILIVDEVLSVGDAEFQRKCIGKMESIGAEGRTILFVSHNMSAVTRMCDRVILLKDGGVIMDGSANEVVSSYLQSGKGQAAHREWPVESAPGGEIARLRSISIINPDGQTTDAVDIRKAFQVQIEFDVLKSGHELLPAFSLWNDEGLLLFSSMDLEKKWRGVARSEGRYVCRAEIPGNLLSEGTLLINTALWEWEPHRRLEYHEKEVVSFQVLDSLSGDSARGDFVGELRGAVRPLLEWKTECISGESDVQVPAASL